MLRRQRPTEIAEMISVRWTPGVWGSILDGGQDAGGYVKEGVSRGTSVLGTSGLGDGPSPGWTPQIGTTLRSRNPHA